MVNRLKRKLGTVYTVRFITLSKFKLVLIDVQDKYMFKHRLCTWDSFSDTAKAWNEERSFIVQETLDQPSV
jgi:hypothetical protein